MAQVFIAFTDRDPRAPKSLLQNLFQALRSQGITFEPTHSADAPGFDSSLVIEDIDEANVVLYISRADSNSSTKLARELAYALRQRKPIVVLQCDGSPYNPQIAMQLQRVRTISADSDNSFAHLLDELRAYLPTIAEPHAAKPRNPEPQTPKQPHPADTPIPQETTAENVAPTPSAPIPVTPPPIPKTFPKGAPLDTPTPHPFREPRPEPISEPVHEPQPTTHSSEPSTTQPTETQTNKKSIPNFVIWGLVIPVVICGLAIVIYLMTNNRSNDDDYLDEPEIAITDSSDDENAVASFETDSMAYYSEEPADYVPVEEMPAEEMPTAY